MCCIGCRACLRREKNQKGNKLDYRMAANTQLEMKWTLNARRLSFMTLGKNVMVYVLCVRARSCPRPMWVWLMSRSRAIWMEVKSLVCVCLHARAQIFEARSQLLEFYSQINVNLDIKQIFNEVNRAHSLYVRLLRWKKGNKINNGTPAPQFAN